ncbi:MAG: hypothetical protein ACOC8B_01685, partial [Gemmatimonadota bacterium]
SDAFEALGPLAADRLAEIADLGADGELDPATLPAGGALTAAPGDLVLTSGTGAGVLVVLGDLTVRSGARFHGAVYVLGRLVIESDAVVYGAARVASREHASEIDGAIEYAPCALDQAFRASDALNRPFRPSGRWWVPLF